MQKNIKYVFIALGGLIGLLVITVIVIVVTFNPNDYKPQIIELMQEKKQRTLSIPGEIKLTFFPKIGADLGRISISEHQGSAMFASVESARISLRLMPIFSKQLVIDRIKIDGLTANIKRYKNGTTNFDDLLAKEEDQSEQIKFDVDSVSIAHTNIFFDDQMAGRKLQLTQVNLTTAKIANGKPSKLDLKAEMKTDDPRLAAHLAVKSGFNVDLEQKHYAFTDINAEVKGLFAGFSDAVATLQGGVDIKPARNEITLQNLRFSVKGTQGVQTMAMKLEAPKFAVTENKIKAGKISGQLTMAQAGRQIEASLAAPSFEGTPRAFSIVSLGLEVKVKHDEFDAKAKVSGTINGDIDKLVFTSPQLLLNLDGKQGAGAIKGTLTTPLTANMKTQLIELGKINADFALPNPGGGLMTVNAVGHASANLAKQTLAAALKGKLDQSTFNIKLGLAKFSPPAYTFDLTIDQIDADRYTKKPSTAASDKPGGKDKMGGAEKLIDLSALKDLNANGIVKIGSLKAANIKASNVRLEVRAAGGKVEVSPPSANLYQGSTAGALSIAAATSPYSRVR